MGGGAGRCGIEGLQKRGQENLWKDVYDYYLDGDSGFICVYTRADLQIIKLYILNKYSLLYITSIYNILIIYHI